MTPRFAILAIVLFLSPGSPAEAHEYWLAPSRYVTAPGAAIEIRALAGTGFRGEMNPWDPGHAVRFSARTSRPLDLTRAAAFGDVTWTRFASSDAGGAMVAFESGFTSIELPAAQFDRYLADEGLDGPLAARRGGKALVPGRERYRRCAKAWLRGSATDRATAIAGFPLEIVPLAIPGPDPALRTLVLWKGRPLAGALVKAWRAPLGASGEPTNPGARDSVGVSWRGRTDSRGEVSVPVAQAGEWLLSAVHMDPCPDRSEADWESTWASLTFQR